MHVNVLFRRIYIPHPDVATLSMTRLSRTLCLLMPSSDTHTIWPFTSSSGDTLGERACLGRLGRTLSRAALRILLFATFCRYVNKGFKRKEAKDARPYTD